MSRILVVESTEFLGLKMVRMLEDSGQHQVDMKSGRLLALKNSHYVSTDVDLIIIGLENQYINPLVVIKDIHNNKETAELPIIAIGSDTDWGTLKSALASGVCDFIVKPFSEHILLGKVDKWLDSKEVNAVDLTHYKGDPIALDAVTGIQWNDDFAIGIEAVDKDHKAIFDKYQTLYDHMKKGLGHAYYDEMTEFLTAYVDAHFSREEAYQASINYKGIDEHKAYHKNFIDELKGMIDAKVDKEISNADLIRMNMFIKDWLLHHIFIEDRKYVVSQPKTSS